MILQIGDGKTHYLRIHFADPALAAEGQKFFAILVGYQIGIRQRVFFYRMPNDLNLLDVAGGGFSINHCLRFHPANIPHFRYIFQIVSGIPKKLPIYKGVKQVSFDADNMFSDADNMFSDAENMFSDADNMFFLKMMTLL